MYEVLLKHDFLHFFALFLVLIDLKTKLTKTIMSCLSFTCALGCLVTAIAAVGTSANGEPAPDAATAESAP